MNQDNIPEIALQWHQSGQGAVLATVVETWGSAPRQAGSQLVVAGDGRFLGSVSGGCVEGAVVEEAQEALRDGKPRLLSFGVSDENAFAVGLACGGKISVLIDPRSSFGAQHRFPGEKVVEDWPDEAMAALAPDSRTAVVTLTHDAKLDDPALRVALTSSAFYIGCLGSSRTHAKRLERLRAAGVTEEAIARLHAPVGLAIRAKSPSEIAVSIMAQITQVLRQG